ncbi:MAG: hypothetical protein ACSHXB_19710 [Sulfitobacter sp.]
MTTEPKPANVSDTDGLDPNSLAAIRNLLAAEPEVKPQPVEERQAAKVEAAFAPLPDADEGGRGPRQPVSQPAPQKPSKSKKKIPQNSIIARVKASILGYRPSAKHIVLACLALLIVFRPWLVLGILFLSLFIVMGIFLILGYDGFWRRGMGLARWYARRRPQRSAELHRKLDSFAMKWDAVLDRFPEGSVDGLYLPDFGDLAEAEARHDATLDRRFDSLRNNGA